MNRKLKIGQKEYNFKLTNKTVFELDEVYGNWARIYNGVMSGENAFNNALKIISLSCVDTTKEFNKETREYEQKRTVFTPEGLMMNLTPQQVTFEIVNFACGLIYDYMGVKEISEEEQKEESNTKKK